MLCCWDAGAMLHKRTAVAPLMPATAADMLLPAAAPILYHAPGIVCAPFSRDMLVFMLTYPM